MSMETYSTFEYTEIKYEVTKDKEKADPERSIVYLNDESIEYLEGLNVAQVYRNRIRFQNYVGVISFKDLRIEVLPKFMKTGEKLIKAEDVKNRGEILSNLVKMLEFSGWGGIRSVDLTRLGIENEFFEVYVYLFAKNLANLLKTNRDAAYTRTYDELRFVRGKIDFRRYCNPARLHRIPCNYHERSADTAINRTLKYVSFLLLRKIISVETRRLLQSIIATLNATLAPVTISEVDRIVFNRLNSSFEPYIDFCNAFLRRSVLSLQGSEVEFFSFLIPMDMLFERFIARAVKETLKDWKVNVQNRYGYLAKTDSRKMFALQPDIVLEKGESRIVVDTKYKLLNPEERKLGVSQQDLYQMYAYCRELNSRKCVLIYPEGVNSEIKCDLKLGKDEEIDLRVRTVPLKDLFENGELSSNFKNRLKVAIGLD
jgi:5-methylcytosine-specific restriction enzyme subunit McrC